MVPFGVLSRINVAGGSTTSTLNPRPSNLLQPLSLLQKSQLLWNQANPASFCKTPRVGVAPQKLVRCTEAQKCLFVSPFLATLTQTPGMGVPPLFFQPWLGSEQAGVGAGGAGGGRYGVSGGGGS